MKLKTSVIFFIIFIIAITSGISGPYNYAELWRSWSIVAREAYISGVTDGIAEAYFVTMGTVAPEKIFKTPVPADVKEVRDKLFVRYTRDQIRDVITDLYKDPANSFITTLDMFFLARDKIEGKDIGKGLMEARKKAMDNYQLNKDMRR